MDEYDDEHSKRLTIYQAEYKYNSEQEWYPTKRTAPPHSKIEKIVKAHTGKQRKLLADIEIPAVLPKSNVHTVYVKKQQTFQIVGYKCVDCAKLMATWDMALKHELICQKPRNKLVKLQAEEEIMPIQKVTKNGQEYYRWGTHGKLYKNRTDAEKQAAAAYASGFREPRDKSAK